MSWCSPEEAIKNWKNHLELFFKWFENNIMKENPDKCHILVGKIGSFVANIGEDKISSVKIEKFLVVTFDN